LIPLETAHQLVTVNLGLNTLPETNIIGHEFFVTHFTTKEAIQHFSTVRTEVLVDDSPRRNRVNQHAIAIETNGLD